MQEDNFFTFVISTAGIIFSVLIEGIVELFHIIGKVLIGLILFVSFISFFVSPVISILYWVDKQVISFIPLQLGSWLFPVVWVVLTCIGILTISGCLYYSEKYDDSPEYPELRGWPD